MESALNHAGVRSSVGNSRLAKVAPVFFVTGTLVLLLCLIPFRTAVTLGGDEGMEFCKATLMWLRPDLLPRMWNDQPLLYTAILSRLFALFGPEAWLARLLTLGSTGVLLLSMLALLPAGSKWPGQVSCILLLISWRSVPELTMSAMCELPALSLALASAAAASRLRAFCLGPALSGVLFALSLHIKLTAIIVLPALLVAAWFSGVRRPISWLVWLGCAVGTFSLLVYLTPGWSWDLVWNSHFEAKAALAKTAPSAYRLTWTSFLDVPAPVLAATVAAVTPRKRNHWGVELAFPLALLATAFGIHSVHRPWWWYYDLHFAIPFSMLGSFGFSVLWESAFRRSLHDKTVLRARITPFAPAAGATIGSAVVALWVSFQLPYFIQEVHRLRGGLKSEDSELINSVHGYAPNTVWAFARGPGLTVAFAEGLLVPPELIILSKKRFWSQRITEAEVLQTVQQYEPELLLLPRQTERLPAEWQALLATNYTFVHDHPLLLAFVHKRLGAKGIVPPNELVRRFGL